MFYVLIRSHLKNYYVFILKIPKYQIAPLLVVLTVKLSKPQLSRVHDEWNPFPRTFKTIRNILKKTVLKEI